MTYYITANFYPTAGHYMCSAVDLRLSHLLSRSTQDDDHTSSVISIDPTLPLAFSYPLCIYISHLSHLSKHVNTNTCMNVHPSILALDPQRLNRPDRNLCLPLPRQQCLIKAPENKTKTLTYISC